jgi:hypothetical protein
VSPKTCLPCSLLREVVDDLISDTHKELQQRHNTAEAFGLNLLVQAVAFAQAGLDGTPGAGPGRWRIMQESDTPGDTGDPVTSGARVSRYAELWGG